MTSSKRRIHLGLFLQGAGHHVAGWRYPGAESGSENLLHLQNIAAIAERAKFDMVFLADGLTSGADAHPSMIARFEPLTLLGVLAASTRQIGLIGTASTTYGEPFHLARAFASLDLLSGGRVGWNVVTTSYARTAANFSAAHPSHEERYAVAEEFVDVVKGLWDSWDDDAFPKDKERGIYADVSKMHVLNHTGKYFSVKGPLNIPRPPQGHPIIVQAGSSDPGQALAARTADVVFTAQDNIDDARVFYAGLKAQVVAHGRAADSVAIMPGFLPIIGRTSEEARDKLATLEGWTDPTHALPLLNERLGTDVSGYDLDGPLPDLPPSDQLKSRSHLLINLARRENMTIRQLAQRVAAGRGHRLVCGTPVEIADELQLWFETGAADGFNIMPPYFPGGLQDFADHVLPILQERGLFRTDYDGSTLRDHFGLPRAPSRYAGAAEAVAV